jgi:hypothetical protein
MAKRLIISITFCIFDGDVKVFLVVLDAVGEEGFVLSAGIEQRNCDLL